MDVGCEGRNEKNETQVDAFFGAFSGLISLYYIFFLCSFPSWSPPHVIIAFYGVQCQDVKLESDGVSISTCGGRKTALINGYGRCR